MRPEYGNPTFTGQRTASVERGILLDVVWTSGNVSETVRTDCTL